MKKILSGLGSEPIPRSVREVSIVLTTDREIRLLNKRYRNKDKATDVLSFPQLHFKGKHAEVFSTSLGDLVISVDTAKRQAREFEVHLESELDRLLVHGLLHLFGYDHENVTRGEARKMKMKESKLFKML